MDAICVPKNKHALHFYEREDFKIEFIQVDKHTGEKEYTMLWEQEN